MSRRILHFERPVARPRKDLTLSARYDGAHGHLASRGRSFGLGKGKIHGAQAGFRFVCHDRTLPRTSGLGKRHLPVLRSA